MNRFAACVLAAALVSVACASATADPPPIEPGDGSGADPASIPSQITVSAEIPSVDELLESGLSRTEAECFIAEIDPESTGEFRDPDLFMVAFAACFDTG